MKTTAPKNTINRTRHVTYLCNTVSLIALGGPRIRQLHHHSRIAAINDDRHSDAISHWCQQRFEKKCVANQTVLCVVRRDNDFVLALRLGIQRCVQDSSSVARKLHKNGVARHGLFRNRFKGFDDVVKGGWCVILVVKQNGHEIRALGKAVHIDNVVLMVMKKRQRVV